MFFYAAKKKKKSAQSTANHSHVSSTYHLISRCHIQNPNTPPKKKIKRFFFRLKKSKSPCSLLAPATSHPQQQPASFSP
jgi:hypothetical protein